MAKENTFSFRAECASDVEALMDALEDHGIKLGGSEQRLDSQYPDVDVELQLTCSLNTLKGVFKSITVGHIMAETLKECCLDDNDLIRDAGVWNADVH